MTGRRPPPRARGRDGRGRPAPAGASGRSSPRTPVRSAHRRRRPSRARVRLRRLGAAVVIAAVAMLAASLLTRGDSTRVAAAPTVEAPSGVTPAPAKGTPVALTRDLEVAAVGDLVMGAPPYGVPSDGGASLFSSVKSLLVGDVVMANLEGTLSTGGASKCGGTPSANCYAFQTPPSYVRWLREAGITVVNLANNHSADFGDSAREQTRTVLRSAGIAAAGQPEGTITYMTRAGGTIAAVGFGFNQQMNSVLDLDRARAIVTEAARHAGVVIVTMHAGAEGSAAQHLTFGSEMFLGEDRGNPVQFARAMVDAGADLVIGHGPHVMRAMEVRKGRLIAYSLGNFMGYATFNLSGPSGQSGVLRVRLAKDGRLLGGKLTSLALYGKGVPAPGGQSVATVRQLTAADLGATGVKMDPDGTIAGVQAQ